MRLNTATGGAPTRRSAGQNVPTDSKAKARKLGEILEDSERKGLILGVKDFVSLAQIAEFSPEALEAYAEQHPSLVATIIGAYSD